MRRPLRSERARALADLAIELGDPGRMARARRLHRSGAVTSIAVQSGEIDAVVYGGRPEPYRVALELVGSTSDNSTLMAGNLLSSCECADFADVCKHALATVLGFAEEVEVEPDLVEDFLGRSLDSPERSRPQSFESDPYFTGEWTGEIPLSGLGQFKVATPTSLIVDGVDAWPVLRSAISRMAEQVSPRRAL